jgi:hypothetical protein
MLAMAGRVLGPPRTARFGGRSKANTKSVGLFIGPQQRLKFRRIEGNPPYYLPSNCVRALD